MPMLQWSMAPLPLLDVGAVAVFSISNRLQFTGES